MTTKELIEILRDENECNVLDYLDEVADRLETLSAELEELRKRHHGMTNSRLYRIWKSMRQRCYSLNNKDYKDYGGRGISVCKEWSEFTVFYEWAMENGYREDLSIDRIDNNGNYCPENCRWATASQQQKNKRCKRLSYNGETHSIDEWAAIIGISNSGIRYRISQNLPIEEVLKPKGGAV